MTITAPGPRCIAAALVALAGPLTAQISPARNATPGPTQARPDTGYAGRGRTAAPRRSVLRTKGRRRQVVPVTAPSTSSGRAVTLRFAAPGEEDAPEPVLTCAVLRACVIDLEPGEQLLGRGPIIGDAVRWRLGTAPTGPSGASSIVWVKPTDCALATNLVLPTDRRVYHLALASSPCGGSAPGARGRYTSHVRFTYPDDAPRPAVATAPAAAVRGGQAQATAYTRPAPGAGAATPALAGIPVDAMRLNFSYGVRRDRRFPWAPAHVFDDGGHTFIQLPPEADAYAAPALFELDDAGGKLLLNYVVRDGYYVTDRTFRRAALVVGQGKHEQRVELENRAFGRVPGATHTGGAGRGTP